MRYTSTAADLRAGDFLHRVETLPLSAVFATPVDLTVERVEPFTSDRDEAYVAVYMSGPYNTRLNLRTTRGVLIGEPA